MKLGSLMPVRSLWDEPLAALARRFPSHEFVLDPTQTLARIAEIDAILASLVDPELFKRATSLKAVFVPFTGVNHLPADFLLQRGVRVYNVHGNAESVAQCALAMALALYGRTIEYHNDLRSRRWHGFWVGGGAADEWTSIWRKRCLVVGTGAIGSTLARLLKAFECDVTGYRRRPSLEAPPNFDRIETDLGRAFEAAEIIFVTLPLTSSTRGLVSRDILLSARGKVLVNVGRGAVVDEEGLYLALRDGILRGAAIDTWYQYPQAGSKEGDPSHFPIHELPNVVISPHIAGSTAEASLAGAQQTIVNMAQWLETGSCSHEADLREMY